MKYFDVSEATNARMAELEKASPEQLTAKLDPDPEKGMQQIADLLTFLPEEERLPTVRRYLVGMLSTAS